MKHYSLNQQFGHFWRLLFKRKCITNTKLLAVKGLISIMQFQFYGSREKYCKPLEWPDKQYSSFFIIFMIFIFVKFAIYFECDLTEHVLRLFGV